MPELPEIETIRRGLGPLLIGRRVQHADRRGPDVGAGAVALDERDDRVLGHLQLAVADRDLLARRNLDSRCCHGASPLLRVM